MNRAFAVNVVAVALALLPSAGVVSPPSAWSQDDASDASSQPRSSRRPSAWSQEDDGSDGAVVPVNNSQPEPEPAVQAQVSEQPLAAESSLVNLSDGLWGGGLPFDRVTAERRQAIETQIGGGQAAGLGLVGNQEGVARNALDAADMLTKAVSTTNVYSWQRSPLMNDVRIRGYRYEQVRNTAGGALFFPVTPNLDTPLSHIDAAFVQDVAVVKGPYSVRLGPGFSFIDVQLLESRRAAQGTEYGGRSAGSFNSNGDQFMLSQSGWIATQDSGLFLGYTQRGGGNYHTGGSASMGGDESIAANYSVRDVYLTYGKDLDVDSRIEVNYLRNDATNISLPSQVDDLSFTHTDAVNLKFVSVDKGYYDKLQLTSWFNQTSLAGDSNYKSFDDRNPNGYYVALQPGTPFGTNAAENPERGSNYSTGARGATTWGDVDASQLTLGLDTTVIRQTSAASQKTVIEPGTSTVPGLTAITVSPFGIPRTTQTDAGLFADSTIRFADDRTTVNVGARYDYVMSQQSSYGVYETDTYGPISYLFGPTAHAGAHNVFHLGSGYVSADYILDNHWTGLAGFGVAEVAPTPYQLYSFRAFLQDMTQVNTYDSVVTGNSALKKQTANQFDLGLRGKYQNLRCELHGYYSYVANFATFGPIIAGDPPSEQLAYVNHNAILAGAEYYMEYDLSPGLTAFGSLAYQYGQDLVINAPLWGMFPLTSNVGFRLHDPSDDHRWNMEWVTQMVDAQNRLSPPAMANGGFENGEIRTPGYTINNLRANYALTRRLNFTAGVTNLGNRLYRTAYDGQHNFNTLAASQLAIHPIYQPGASFYFVVEAKY